MSAAVRLDGQSLRIDFRECHVGAALAESMVIELCPRCGRPGIPHGDGERFIHTAVVSFYVPRANGTQQGPRQSRMRMGERCRLMET